MTLTERELKGGRVLFVVAFNAKDSPPFSKGSLEWVVGYRGPRDFTAFRLDAETLFVRQVGGVEKKGSAKHGMNWTGKNWLVAVQMDLNGSQPVLSYALGDGPIQPLPRSRDFKVSAAVQTTGPAEDVVPSRSPEGRFGFIPDGAGKLEILSFFYYPPVR